MWWFLALLAMLAAGVSFIGVAVSMFKQNRLWIKRFIISFIVCFLIAFISVGMAGVTPGS